MTNSSYAVRIPGFLTVTIRTPDDKTLVESFIDAVEVSARPDQEVQLLRDGEVLFTMNGEAC